MHYLFMFFLQHLTDFHIGRALIYPHVFQHHEVLLDPENGPDIDAKPDTTKLKHISTMLRKSKANTSLKHVTNTPVPYWLRLYQHGDLTAEVLLSVVLTFDKSSNEPAAVTSIPRSLCPSMRRYK